MSYNFRNRFNAETVDKIFNWILDEIANEGYLNPEAVFIDGTHIKANANKNKKIKEQVPVAAKRYSDELLEEINADREAHGKEPFDDNSKPPKSKNQQKKNNTSKKRQKRRKQEAKMIEVTKSTTDREGYREYKSDPKICEHCLTRHLCTASKDFTKTVQNTFGAAMWSLPRIIVTRRNMRNCTNSEKRKSRGYSRTQKKNTPCVTLPTEA